ncbi:MAG: UPF0175 family protein [Candidatus Helarchaeota archaeon]
MKKHRIKKAMEIYREKKVSLWKAAEIARITYREALEEIRMRNIPFNYDEKELEKDLKWILKQ